MPGQASLDAGEYYHNTGNHFWKFIFKYFDREFTDDYDVRKEVIVGNGIALWDVLETCVREKKDGKKTSLDSMIKNGVFNDIEGFVKEHSIKAIFVLGKTAQKLFDKKFLHLQLAITVEGLPSTSGLNSRDLEGQYGKWENLLGKYLVA